ncbi:MAG: hypothetical protein WDO74_08700 [Pseudomonadota bacterium]
MRPPVTNWHDVALAKLTSVMGPSVGQQLAASVLEELALASLTSPAELRRFATALATRGGFASAVAALLTLHAAMYESAERRSA